MGLRILDLHHRVRSVGHRCARHDLDRRARTHRRRGDVSGREILKYLEYDRSRSRVAGPDCVAVHGRVGERWNIMRGEYRLAQDQARSLEERHVDDG
jgi:hypothetical protein